MKKILYLIPLAALCISCLKENDAADADSAIRFSAEAAAPETKVSYSGGDDAGKERLEWSLGDRFSVWCAESAVKKVASYSVTGTSSDITNTGATSTASKVGAVNSSSVLEWGPSPSYTFYARYPDPTWTEGAPADATYTGQELAGSEFTCVIPAAQAPTKDGDTFTYLPQMQYCYMTAYTTAAKKGTVALNFTPVVSCFEISIANSYIADNEAFTVSRVELISSSKRLNGTYTVTMGASPTMTVPTSTSADDRKITFTPNVTVTSGETLKFTVFTCPVDIAGTDGDHLSVKIYLSNGDTRTKELKNGGAWLSYAAGGKYRINCGTVPDPYNYNIDTDVDELVIDCQGVEKTATFKVFSTKSKLGFISGTPWTVEYSTDPSDPGSWSDTSPVDGFSAEPSSTAGSTAGETVTVTMPAGTPGDLGTIAIDNFHFSSTKGGATSGSPRDLSYYDGVEDKVLGTQETANCYIIRGPGWYSFPLVYGNGIKNGVVNTGAYHLASAGSGQLQDLVNANGNIYSAGTIADVQFTASSAELLWQDRTEDIITNISISGGNKVVFQVQNPQPCNAVIQVKNAGGTVLWSWHIWLVADEQHLEEAEVTNYQGRKFGMLTSNLGQLPLTTASATGYPSQDVYVRLTTTVDPSRAQSVVIRVNRPRHITSSTPNGYIINPYYQWGRKDPMLPAGADGSERSKTGTVGQAYKGIIEPPSENYKTTVTTIANVIQTPGIFYCSSEYSWHSGTQYYNLWDMTRTSSTPSSDYSASTKTVYDPCPRGYKVARRFDFTGFTSDGDYSGTRNVVGSWSQGWFFEKDASDKEGIFFPASGNRTSNNGGLFNINSVGSVITSVAADTWRIYYFTFSSSSASPLSQQYRSIGISVRPVKD